MKIQFIGILLCVGMISSAISVVNSNGNQIDELEIGEVTGGVFRVKAEINNIGDIDISDIDWKIEITGGFLERINKTTTGLIPVIPVNGKEIITSSPIIGFGRITIHITVNDVDKTVNGFIFLCFILSLLSC